jgi:hypothetical protein
MFRLFIIFFSFHSITTFNRILFFTGVNDTNSPFNSCVDDTGQKGYAGIVYAHDVLPLPAAVVVQSVILLLLLPANATVTAFLQQMLQIAGGKNWKISVSRLKFALFDFS